MRILAVDVGTGTQDILVFDSEKDIENSIKMVMPSPTVIVAEKIRQATERGLDILLTGTIMGGGPCGWAAKDHLQKGFSVYSTATAAQTFDDDLSEVRAMGVELVSEDEVNDLSHLHRIELKDFYLEAISAALRAFNVDGVFEAIAIAVFDHGAAPPGVSDRAFRFDYIADTINQGGQLVDFAYLRENIPPQLTRMQAVAQGVNTSIPLLLMDTGFAAILGALEDEKVSSQDPCLVVNIGNFHTLAFELVGGRIVGLFEHHTHKLGREKLEDLLKRLAEGSLSNEEVFSNHGHGAFILDKVPRRPEFVAVTGPRRGLMRGSVLSPYNAVPHGDMMLAGCFGLLRAFAKKVPDFQPAIEKVLGKK